MLIVKVYKYEGNVKIRCHNCGHSTIKSFIKNMPNIHWECAKEIKCRNCGTVEKTENIKYMFGIRKLRLQDVLVEGGYKFSGCGSPDYIPDEHDYHHWCIGLNGRYGSFSFKPTSMDSYQR